LQRRNNYRERKDLFAAAAKTQEREYGEGKKKAENN
jgi:hypothetical protein